MTKEEIIEGLYHIKNWECDGNAEMHKVIVAAIEALEKEPILDKIKGYIDHIRNTGMGKKKSLEFIEKFIEGVKV